MPTPDPIATQMRAARQHRGWSLTTMDAKTGIPAVVIGSYERGDRQPSLAKLREWLGHLDHDLVALGPASDADGRVWTEYACAYPRPDVDGGTGLIVCDNVAEALVVAEAMAGGRVVSRRVRATEWTGAAGG